MKDYENNNQFDMANDDEYDDIYIERDEYYDPEEGEYYEDDQYYEDEYYEGEYAEDEYYEDEYYEDEYPEEEYYEDEYYEDEYYDDYQEPYDDRFDRVLSEIEQLKSSMRNTAPNNHVVQPPYYQPQQVVPIQQGNDATVYELNRLRDELSRAQNQQAMQAELLKIREEFARNQMMNANAGMTSHANGAVVGSGISQQEFNRLINLINELSNAIRTSDAHHAEDMKKLRAEIKHSANSSQSAPINLDEVKDVVTQGDNYIAEVIADNTDHITATVIDGLSGVIADTSANTDSVVLNAIADSTANAENQILTAIANAKNGIVQAINNIDVKSGDFTGPVPTFYQSANLPSTSTTIETRLIEQGGDCETLKLLYEIKKIIGTSAEERETIDYYLAVIDGIAALETEVSRTKDVTLALKAVYEYQNKISGLPEGELNAVVQRLNAISSKLLATPVTDSNINRILSLNSVCNGMLLTLSKEALVKKFLTQTEVLRAADQYTIIEATKDLAETKNGLMGRSARVVNDGILAQITALNSDVLFSEDPSVIASSNEQIAEYVEKLSHLSLKDLLDWPVLERSPAVSHDSEDTLSVMEMLDDLRTSVQSENEFEDDNSTIFQEILDSISMLRDEIMLLGDNNSHHMEEEEDEEQALSLGDEFDEESDSNMDMSLQAIENLKIIADEMQEIKALREEMQEIRVMRDELALTNAQESGDLFAEINSLKDYIYSLRESDLQGEILSELSDLKNQVLDIQAGALVSEEVVSEHSSIDAQSASDINALRSDVLGELGKLESDISTVYRSELDQIKASIEQLPEEFLRKLDENPAQVQSDILLEVNEVKEQVLNVYDQLPIISEQLYSVSDYILPLTEKVDVISEKVPSISDKVDLLAEQLPTISDKVDALADQIATLSLGEFQATEVEEGEVRSVPLHSSEITEKLNALAEQLPTISDKVDALADQIATLSLGDFNSFDATEQPETEHLSSSESVDIAEKLNALAEQIPYISDKVDALADQLATISLGEFQSEESAESTDLSQKLDALAEQIPYISDKVDALTDQITALSLGEIHSSEERVDSSEITEKLDALSDQVSAININEDGLSLGESITNVSLKVDDLSDQVALLPDSFKLDIESINEKLDIIRMDIENLKPVPRTRPVEKTIPVEETIPSDEHSQGETEGEYVAAPVTQDDIYVIQTDLDDILLEINEIKSRIAELPQAVSEVSNITEQLEQISANNMQGDLDIADVKARLDEISQSLAEELSAINTSIANELGEVKSIVEGNTSLVLDIADIKESVASLSDRFTAEIEELKFTILANASASSEASAQTSEEASAENELDRVLAGAKSEELNGDIELIKNDVATVIFDITELKEQVSNLPELVKEDIESLKQSFRDATQSNDTQGALTGLILDINDIREQITALPENLRADIREDIQNAIAEMQDDMRAVAGQNAGLEQTSEHSSIVTEPRESADYDDIRSEFYQELNKIYDLLASDRDELKTIAQESDSIIIDELRSIRDDILVENEQMEGSAMDEVRGQISILHDDLLNFINQTTANDENSAAYIEAIKTDLDALREEVAQGQDESVIENVRQELEALREEVINLSAINTVTGEETSGLVDAVKVEIDALREELQAYANDNQTSDKDEIVESIRSDIDILREEIINLSNATAATEEQASTIIDAVKSEINTLRNEIYQSNQNRILEAAGEGNEVGTEALNLVFDELSKVREDLTKLRDKDTTSVITKEISDIKEQLSAMQATASEEELQSSQSAVADFANISEEINALRSELLAYSENVQASADNSEILQEIKSAIIQREEQDNSALLEEITDIKTVLSLRESADNAELLEEVASLKNEIASLKESLQGLTKTDESGNNSLLEGLGSFFGGASSTVSERSGVASSSQSTVDTLTRSDYNNIMSELARMRDDMNRNLSANLSFGSTDGSNNADLANQINALRTDIALSGTGVEVDNGLREEIASLRTQLLENKAVTEKAVEQASWLESMSNLRADLMFTSEESSEQGTRADIINKSLADILAEMNTLKAEIAEIATIKEQMAEQPKLSELASELAEIKEMLLFNQPIVEVDNSVILNEVASLKEMLQNAPPAPVNDNSDLLNELRTLRAELYVGKPDGTDWITEIERMRSDIAREKAVENQALLDEINKLKQQVDDTVTAVSAEATNNAILEQLARLKDELNTQREADNTTIMFMAEMAHLLEKQNDSKSTQQNELILQELSKLKQDVAEAKKMPMSDAEIIGELGKVKQALEYQSIERNEQDNMEILKELRSLKSQIGGKRATENADAILSEINHLKDDVNYMLEGENTDRFITSLTDISAELNDIASMFTKAKSKKAPANKPASNSSEPKKPSTRKKKVSNLTSKKEVVEPPKPVEEPIDEEQALRDAEAEFLKSLEEEELANNAAPTATEPEDDIQEPELDDLLMDLLSENDEDSELRSLADDLLDEKLKKRFGNNDD